MSGIYANFLQPERISSPSQSCSPLSEINFYEVPSPPKAVGERWSVTSDQNLTPPFSKSYDSDLYHTPPSSGRSDQNLTPPFSKSHDSDLYHMPPSSGRSDQNLTPPFSKSHDSDLYNTPPSSGRSSSSPYETPPPHREIDTFSKSTTHQSTPEPGESPVQPTRFFPSSNSEPVWYEIPSPGNKYCDPTKNNSSTCQESKLGDEDSVGTFSCTATSTSNYIPMTQLKEAGGSMKLQPPAKPPRRPTVTTISPSNKLHRTGSDSIYEYLCLATSGREFAHPARGGEEYVDMKLRNSIAENYENTNTVLADSTDGASDDKVVNLENPQNTEKCDELSDRPPEANEEYQSTKCGLFGIDTDNEIVTTFDTEKHTGVALEVDKKPVSADNIEEIIDDDPFAGLFRGSLCPTNCSDDFKISFHVSNTQLTPPPPPPRRTAISRRSRNIYENVGIKMESGGRSRPNLQDPSEGGRDDNRNSLSVMSPFDENAEWAEIADIMASFGSGIARESVFSNEMEEHFTNVLTLGRKEASKKVEEKKFKTVEEWLSHLRLSDYENLFLINGFDDIEFLGGNILEDQDLQEIGISNEEHRERILNFSKKLQPIQPIGKDEGKIRMPESVNHWLKLLHLEEYQDTFQKNGFTNMDRVMKIWEVELNTVLEIKKLGHQKRILASLGERTPEQYMGNLEDFDLSKLNSKLSELGIEEAPSTEVCKEDAGLFKDYTNVTSTRRENKGSQSLTQTLSGDKGELRIRPPTQLMSEQEYVETSSSRQQISGVPACLTAQWCHQPDALIKGHCIYKAQYLGSTLIKELKGLESTRKSIQKLKVSTKQIEKVPNILLSISYTGVKFIDAETEHKVCEHEIRNIHCACQDAEDLNHFAYITKEHQTNYHYCHVFCAESIDLATEIILTLGQAFEVAYQIALRDKGAKSSKSTQKLKQFLNKCDDRKLSEKGNSDTPPVVKSLVQPDASVSEEEELKISKQIS
ncbi:uncharacterized protein LOC106470250 isoform X3 [Limulus polyphemus]|uniref:Uncharacterized protein LOC106470250 isoform X3 n=1 Tax=Limulus polyphemus TaxID=6850 RepID=A0ABM1TFA0_LIMPO|nr:uncharacterized protein LOC106470250 isoform X3 [Limulus polyphemus]